MRIFTLFVLIASSHAFNLPNLPGDPLEIICKFFQTSTTLFGKLTDSFYACEVQEGFGFKTGNVVSISGTHIAPKTNADVQVVIIKDIAFALLPTGFDEIFPNLIGLSVTGTTLKHIDSNDLKPFTNLKYLNLAGNELQFLKDNLFKENTALEVIKIEDNSIGYIGVNSFYGLTSLDTLTIGMLICDPSASDAATKTEVASLVAKLMTGCSGTLTFEALFGSFISYHVQEMETCEGGGGGEDCESLESEIKQLKEDVKKIESDKNTCDSEKKELEKKIESLKEEMEDFKNPVNTSCRFKDTEEGYSCTANKISIKTSSDQKVLWTGTHNGTKKASDVKALVAKFQVIQLFPLEVGKTFTNIEKLIIESSGLQKIAKNDFVTLEGLTKLSLTGNEIASIDRESFDILVKLIHLDLSGNKITSLPSKAFNKLAALTHLDVSGNQLMQLRYDLIASDNKIENLIAKNNPKLNVIDVLLILRLREALIVDFTGTGCSLKFDSSLGESFKNDFYAKIVAACG